MKYTINHDYRAVADEIFLQPMSTCPINVEVQLETQGGILIRGRWDGKSPAYRAWFPFPRRMPQAPKPPKEELIVHKELH